LAPEPGPAGEVAGEGRHQPMVRHLLQTQDRGPTGTEIDLLECRAIRPVPIEPTKPAQFRCRIEAGLAQPGARAGGLDDVPDARVARREPRSPVAQPIPSTSIIE